MSNNFVDFKILDYTGMDAVSSYALSSTPLLFYPTYELFEDNDNRVVWDFGDGTISRSTSAIKYYNFPGKYTVNMVLYDCENNSTISYISKDVIIYDLLPLTFNLDFYINMTPSGDYILDDSENITLSSNPSSILLKCGKMSGPIVINSFFPIYQTPINIHYSIANSNNSSYWDINQNKFSHLDNYYSFYDLFYNYSLSGYQYRDIDKIVPNTNEVYARIINNTIEYCGKTDENSFLVGLSANNIIFFKNDSVSDNILIDFFFDKTGYYHPRYEKMDYMNNLKIGLSAKVIKNIPDNLCITSNGLDGEGYPISSFYIDTNKFYNTKIPFVIHIKDDQWFSVKHYDSLELSSLNLQVYHNDELLDTSQYTISSLNYTLSAQNYGGSFRGFVEFTNNTTDVLSNIKISVDTSIIDGLSTYNLSAYSNTFNIYPFNYFDVYKKNENFDSAKNLKDLRFQEIFIDKNVLFDDFFGGIMGDSDSDHEGIYKKIYEKISNFSRNIQDLDTCEIDALQSISDFVDYNDSNEQNYNFPEKIKRLINLSSIDRYKLLGELNKFKENLDIKGRSSKDEYGINIGDLIDTSVYTVSAGTHIVALEKFSNMYTLLNTYQPVSAVGSYTYPLSDYSSDWGWPLVLPTSFDFSDIEKYYLFFEYNDQYDNTEIGGLVDFENVKTTISSTATDEELFGSTGIFVNMFTSALYQTLSTQ